jgi:hypothetical protein
MSLYNLGGIETPVRNDRWVVDQFEGFDGTPWSPGDVAANAAAITGAAGVAAAPSTVNGNGVSVLMPGVGSSVSVVPSIIPGLRTTNPMQSILTLTSAPGGGGGTGMPTGTGTSVSAGNGGGGASGPSVLPALSPMPSATTATMPTVTGTANAFMNRGGRGQRGGNTPHAITPQYLNQRLPSIVNPAPMDMGGNCQAGFGAWVGENPVLAGLGLVALAWMVWGRGK